MMISGPCEVRLDGEPVSVVGVYAEAIAQATDLGERLGAHLRAEGRLPGKKAARRMQREAAAQARDSATAAQLRRLVDEDPAALQRALGMARYDLAVCPNHPAARRLLAIAAAEGIG